jgi:WD40 repeat protein
MVAAATAIVAASLPGSAAAAPDRTRGHWIARYDGGSGNDEAWALAASPDGTRVYVTGPSNNDYATVSYDAATGAQLWVQRFDGPSNADDTATAIGVSPDGSSVFVTGYSSWTNGIDYVTEAIDATTGVPMWIHRYDGPAHGFDFAQFLAVSPDGARVYVSGFSADATGEYDYATQALDPATGHSLWVRRFDGSAHLQDEPRAMAVSPDSATVYVTGYADMGGTGDDYVTIAYQAANGSVRWTKSYNGPGNSSDIADGVTVSPDSSIVYLTGESAGVSSSWDYATMALHAAHGRPIWLRRYNGPGNDFDKPRGIAVSPDGASVFVTGFSEGVASLWDYATIGYIASTGAPIWLQRFGGPANGYDLADGLAMTQDGRTVFVVGHIDTHGSATDYATVAYAASTGRRIGVRRYKGPQRGGNDLAVAISVSADQVFVTGRSDGGSTFEDFASLAYWIGPGSDPGAPSSSP